MADLKAAVTVVVVKAMERSETSGAVAPEQDVAESKSAATAVAVARATEPSEAIGAVVS